MKIGLASDHRGIQLKKRIKSHLVKLGHNVKDFGPDNEEDPVDYPDYGAMVANSVSKGENDKGILICGTGIGMSLAANKVNGVRAALCHDSFTTVMSRKHNDANILCLGNEVINHSEVEKQIDLWLNTEFEGGRHERRVNKITELEK